LNETVQAVEELAGIGPKCGEVLRGKGYTSAYNVLVGTIIEYK